MSASSSTPGQSARREFERRRQKLRESRIDHWGPTLGTAVDRFSAVPATTSSWSKGAEGEVNVARILEKHLVGSAFALLHDRKVPGTRRNIDHMVVCPSGVLVIDTKNIKGNVRVVGYGIGNTRTKVLEVNGRDRTRMITGVREQVRIVEGALRKIQPSVTVDVSGTICWCDPAGLPLTKTLEIDGVRILKPRHTVDRARHPGVLVAAQIELIRQTIAEHFLPA